MASANEAVHFLYRTNMQVQPEISPLIISSIASMYNDSVRVLMEFVDNSLDAFSSISQSDAETHNNIKINIKGIGYKEGKIIIYDDCSGIDELSRILKNIGNSNKKAQSWTNGKFGFGIFSFLAICEKITIETKTKGSLITQQAEISKSDFEKEKISDITFNINHDKKGEYEEAYTKVTLTGFTKEKWYETNIIKLKEEIENHFELLLKDKRINITVKQDRYSERTCESFVYSAIEGDTYSKSFLLNPDFPESDTNPQINIFLKFTPGKSLERLPVFITKQRRVEQINKLKVFDSNNKTKIWSNPYLTGYIDTKSVLNPTLSRDNYKKDYNAKKLFKKLRELEPDMIKFVEKNLSLNQKSNINEIENLINGIINNTVSKFLKEKKKPDELDLNKESSKMDAYLLETPIFIKNPPIHHKKENLTNKKEINQNEITKLPKLNYYDEVKYGEFKVEPKIKDINLTIRINPDNEPPLDKNGNYLKSELINNDVIIYKKHKEFKARLKHDELGIESITESLKFYIIAEFLIYYCRLKYQESQLDPRILDEHNKLLFALEKSLERIVGEPIIKSL